MTFSAELPIIQIATEFFKNPCQEDKMNALIIVLASLTSIILGLILGYIARKIIYEKGLKKAKFTFEKIISEGKKEADRLKKEYLQQGRSNVESFKQDAENNINSRLKLVAEQENKLMTREQSLDNRAVYLDKREQSIDDKDKNIQQKQLELDQIRFKVEEQLQAAGEELERVANLTKEQAKAEIMQDLEVKMQHEMSAYIREEEEKARLEAERKAKGILAIAMQKYASDATADHTISVVNFQDDSIKGRIIGKEGRNIRAFEALTGVDVVIDDTPNAVVLSGFDPIRREVAKKALTALIQDGRIHPQRIEELVEKAQKEVDDYVFQAGEDAVFQMEIGKMNLDLIRIVGRMAFRTSFGQNVLKHSMEVGFLAGKLAAELGENEYIARRAGLLHDIGKAIDHEMEGSHVEIGVKLAQRYKEAPEVIDAISSHHGDREAKSVIAVLVAAADAISASRPGARNESSENYIKRLTQLEEIANSFQGVKKAYAIQAGREIRVMVKPDQVFDKEMALIARNIKERIENEMQYPGTVKITLIRETRVTDFAK